MNIEKNMDTEQLINRIIEKKSIVGILGLGRVGLPLATVFATKGIKVKGIEVNHKMVESIKNSKCPFHDPPLQENLDIAIKLNNLQIIENINEKDNDIDIFIITVGTPVTPDNSVDYSQLFSALEEICKINLKEKMVIFRSTMPPKTTVDIIIPLIENKTGLIAGKDFAIGVCPERILEGKAIKEIFELPEIIGGINKDSDKIATQLFRTINPEKEFSYTSPSGAELAKLFTNIYRYISFALSNEFAIWAEIYGLDATKLINIANYKYERSNVPIPGFVGGPCLSKDGTFLDNNTTFSSIVSAAWKLNESIPMHIINNIKRVSGNLFNKKIAVLGLSFKSGSDDLRSSPSVKLVELLKGLGARVQVHDPHVKNTLSLFEALNTTDIVIVATNHKEFKENIVKINQCGANIIYDVWSMFDDIDFPEMKYFRFGRGFN
jgi:UDP-N-acetyl-D-mannosaminuronic acid dehydrogenase